MDDIHRRDTQVFLRELLRFGPLFLFALVFVFNAAFFFNYTLAVVSSLLLGWAVVAAHNRSVPRRFYNKKFFLLSEACSDRLKRFHEALDEGKERGAPELFDLPGTVDSVGKTLYVALRRADTVMREVTASEGWLMAVQRHGGPITPDQKAQELYRLADKNIAEYRHHYKVVVSGVERTEAQAAVFTTTLDTLRMRMLGHRLAGRSPELEHTEFLQAMTEARMQLDSIDKALDELELTPFPGLDADWLDSVRSIDTTGLSLATEAETRDGDENATGPTSPGGAPPPIPKDARPPEAGGEA